MATIDLGKIKLVWRGTYAGGTAYTVDDVVQHTDGGVTSSFICTTNSTGNAPSTGGSVHSSWAYLAKGHADTVSTTLTTQGDVLYRDGSGLQRLAKGSASQVLKMNTAANAPEWGNLSSDYVKLSTYTVSGTPSSFDWDISFDDSVYNSYYIVGQLKMSTGGQARFRVRQAGTTKTDSNYDMLFVYAYRTVGGSGNASYGGNNGRDYGYFIDWTGTTDCAEFIDLAFSYPSETDTYKPIRINGNKDRQDGGTAYIFGNHTGTCTYRGNKSAITGLHFYPSAGTFITPSVLTCYGLKK